MGLDAASAAAAPPQEGGIYAAYGCSGFEHKNLKMGLTKTHFTVTVAIHLTIRA